jgi:hypothetical protein
MLTLKKFVDLKGYHISTINRIYQKIFIILFYLQMFVDLKGLPLIHSYDSIQELNRNIEKHERRHDLVISSYALGEIPSLNDRITIVRQLWDLTGDVLVYTTLLLCVCVCVYACTYWGYFYDCYLKKSYYLLGFVRAWNSSRSKDYKPNALVYPLDGKEKVPQN